MPSSSSELLSSASVLDDDSSPGDLDGNSSLASSFGDVVDSLGKIAADIPLNDMQVAHGNRGNEMGTFSRESD